MEYVLAIDLGGTKIYSALVGSGTEIVRRDVRPTEAYEGKDRVIANILASVMAVTSPEALQDGLIKAIGLGVPGPYNRCTGRVCYAPNLHWHDVNLAEILQSEFGLPVFVENDANLAALGEHLYGAGRGSENMVFITVSTGVGGGLILNGDLYTSSSGGAGEIGHMAVAPGGPVCSCGNKGCLEAVASGRAIKKRALDLIGSGKGLKILELAGGDPMAVEAPLVTRAGQNGDPEACEILAEAGYYVGLAIGSIANLLNPQLFVIGGGVAYGAGDLLLEPAKKEAVLHVFPDFKQNLNIVPAALRERAGVLGAAAYARRRVQVKN